LDACGDCHTPRLPTGAPDTTKILAGDPAFADLDPTSSTLGLIPTPNLTQLAAKGWTDTDIKNAIQKGKDKNGQGLFPIMPYRSFANMAGVDAEAVAKYILSLTPIGTEDDTPSRQPLPGPLAQLQLPIPTLDPAKIPNPVFAAGTSQADKDAALFGKYLAAEGGPCVDCHSPQNQDFTLDATKLFAGGQTFQIGGPFGVVTSLNITQANNGIHGWTATDVAKVIQQGIDKDGVPLCPPMPFGPQGAFGGLQASDVNAIAQYIIRLPPIENPADGGMISMCVPPGPPPPVDSGADATSTDASSSDASKTD
jgi:mono/diheme cytochrome c family protein